MLTYWKDKVLFDEISGEVYVDEIFTLMTSGKAFGIWVFLVFDHLCGRDCLMDIRFMNQSPTRAISERDQSMELFHAFYDEPSDEKIKLALKELIVTGYISYQEHGC
ncbi:MAG: hypothetical protein QXU18_00005 [Thermoplasmatales archaeon]